MTQELLRSAPSATIDRSPATRHAGSVLEASGPTYFPVALAARLPYAMMVVGVLTLVVSARDSLALGGLNSAMVGIGTALVGPLLGAAADRFGQRRVLVGASLVSTFALALMAWVVYSPLPNAAVLAVAFLIGASAPQVAPMSRSRLVALIGRRVDPTRRDRSFHSTMGYESAADELVFIIGPVLVGVLATWFGPSAPVLGAALLTAVFVTAFALHPTGRADGGHADAEGAEVAAPVAELFRPALLVVVLGIGAVGLFFGATLTALTAFMDEAGHGDQAGLVYGAMGVGSAVLALAVGFFPARFGLAARWVVFSVALLLGAALLPTASSVGAISVMLVVAGIGIGPTLVTQYSLGARRSPVGRSATVMTMLGSAIIVGQAFASAIAGQVAEHWGSHAAMLLPAVAALLVAVAGIANAVITRRHP
ncbi:MFS transporter [Nocardioides sp. GY 10113]|uniref:MFS transporter n=1 Tax=Nocardioides sp. GY 10113 TaxID=2569761 RepID=UPI0010A94272|nr:MFS transporter [Nocardioides sp. GY 10113]TIC81497.1 MFS transporter [Nocardioides sp. GY 10113]